MKRSTFNYIKDILRDYPNIDRYIKSREEELRYPYRRSDVNSDIKAQNKESDGLVNMMITIEQDRRLANLERNRRVISDELDRADDDTKVIIEELYMKKYQRYAMEGLVKNHLISCGRTKAFQLRDNFFENIADELGLDK